MNFFAVTMWRRTRTFIIVMPSKPFLGRKRRAVQWATIMVQGHPPNNSRCEKTRDRRDDITTGLHL